MIEIRQGTGHIDGNKLVGLVAPTWDGSAGTEYDLFGDGTTYERFAPQCWDSYLSTNPDVKCYAHHDRKQIIGRTKAGTLALSVEARGLTYACELPDTTIGKDTKTSVLRGDINGASVGMRNVKAEWSKSKGRDIRTITSAELDHIAPVADPAYQSSTASMRENEREALTQERDKYETEKWQSYIHTLAPSGTLPK